MVSSCEQKAVSQSLMRNSRVCQAKGEIEHVVLIVAGLLQLVVYVWLENDMACRAGDGAFART